MSSVFRLILTQNTAILRRGLTQITSGTIIAAQHHPTVNTNAFAVPPIRRFLSGTATLRCGAKTTNPSEGEEPTSATALAAAVEQNPLDRTRIITLEESLGYLASEAYQQTYGERPVWEQYRRNHKGPFAPRRTRKTCVRKGLISTGNPCPICRDEYLLLDHRNLELLHQFISPHTGEVRHSGFTLFLLNIYIIIIKMVC